MDTNLILGAPSALTAATDLYNPLEIKAGWTATASAYTQPVPIACTFKNLYVALKTAPGAGLSRTFTLQKNGVDTALTVTITDPATTANDLTHQVTFNAGDTMQWHTTASGTTTSTGAIQISVDINAAANTSLVAQGSAAAGLDTAATDVMAIQGNIVPDTVVNNVEQVMPTAGTFKNAYVMFNATVGANPKGYTFTLYVNGSPSALSFFASGTSGNDTTHSVSVSAGDRIYWQAVPSASAPSGRVPLISMQFAPTINGESVRLYGGNTAPSTSVADFVGSTGAGAGSTTEANRYGISQAATMQKLYVYWQTQPGGVASYQVQGSINGSTTGAPSVTVTGANNAGNDSSTTKAITAGQTFSFKITPAGTPASSLPEIGIVSFIQPLNTGNMLLVF